MLLQIAIAVKRRICRVFRRILGWGEGGRLGRGFGGEGIGLFGNGTGFVWYGGGAEQKDVVEGPLVHHVEARFVAVEEAKFRGCSEFAEGAGDAGNVVTLGLGVEFLREEGVFDGPGAAEAPVGSGHLLDHAELDAIERAEAFEVFGEEGVEALARFAGEDDTVGEEAVAEGVEGRAKLPFGGGGATGAGAVGAGRENAA